eukprot:TRINITY_DN3756_c0_g1_i1.p1 TRINITY_DN3756_c0_g1~~TRINITY_DN3756_c0_g1_i1.p1  ORF type:complete len:179 (-),score=24.18 TRINITY_DN3756_c0_g1_i1:64-600(-)
MIRHFYQVIALLIFVSTAFGLKNVTGTVYTGTATNWCGSSGNVCGYPNDGMYGALSSAVFNSLLDCHCPQAETTECGLTRCPVPPSCSKSWCGDEWCVQCADSRCYALFKKIQIKLSDACPADHPNNVDQCCKHSKDFNWCRCEDKETPNIDLACAAFTSLAPQQDSPLKVKFWQGSC